MVSPTHERTTRVAPGAIAATAPPTVSFGTLAQSPADAMHFEEVDRLRSLIRYGWVLTVALLAALPVLDGDPALEVAFAVAMGLGTVGSGLLYRLIRDPAQLTPWRNTANAVVTALVAQVGVVYFGVFSAAAMIMLLGIYFFSRTESQRVAVAVYVTAAGPQAAIGLAIAFGAIEDPGLVSHPPLPTSQLVVLALLTQGLYLLAFVIARMTRRSTIYAMESLQHAMRLAAKREAQLEEVRQDLDRAMRVGGKGHYTGRVLGSFEVGALIGHGAMGEVYEAVRSADGAEAAIKLLHPHVLGDERHIERFLREGRAASALDSPHVVRVFEVSDASAQIPYLAMERLRGEDLAQYLRDHHQLPLVRVRPLVAAVGHVIDLASAKGIVHRDLKPQNLFHAQAGAQRTWKVLDFGVAALADVASSLTGGGAVGTPGYMSPEQARGVRADGRADLHSLAAIAYRCLAGRPPFTGADVPAVLYDIVHTMPERPGAFAELPEDVDLVFAIALAKRPDDRFQTGAELAAAFDAAERSQLADDLRARARALLARLDWSESI